VLLWLCLAVLGGGEENDVQGVSCKFKFVIVSCAASWRYEQGLFHAPRLTGRPDTDVVTHERECRNLRMISMGGSGRQEISSATGADTLGPARAVSYEYIYV